jgi:CRISPR-associated protein Csm2
MADISIVMTADPTGAELVTFARSTAEQLVKNQLTRAQIRNIFTEVRKIEALWQNDPGTAMRRLNMLRPKLAYAAARSESVTHLRDVLSKAIEEVNAAPDEKERNRRFRRFMELFEAILAYHRTLGGRN